MNKSYLNFRTDMADERVDIYKNVHNLTKIEGVKVIKKNENNVNIVIVDILNEKGEKALNKKIGRYITLEIYDSEIIDTDEKENIINTTFKVINKLINDKNNIMVVGLGNENITPDALGAKVVKNLDITRHLFKYASDLVDVNTKILSAIVPGVLGTTGIETFEIVESLVNKIKPDILVVIDSLASKSINRLGKTIQISNTGINPGSGVNNKRKGISKETLGIPVIAIGIPTVVDMATITNEAIDKVVDKSKKELELFNDLNMKSSKIIFSLLNSDQRYSIISNILNTENYIVTPKEIDNIILKMSEIIASSINMVVESEKKYEG